MKEIELRLAVEQERIHLRSSLDMAWYRHPGLCLELSPPMGRGVVLINTAIKYC